MKIAAVDKPYIVTPAAADRREQAMEGVENTSSFAADRITLGSQDGHDSDVLTMRALSQSRGMTFGGRSGVNVYQDNASASLPRGWSQSTQSNGVNAYSNTNEAGPGLRPKVVVVKRVKRNGTPSPAPGPSGPSGSPRPAQKTLQVTQPPSLPARPPVKRTVTREEVRASTPVETQPTFPTSASTLDATLAFMDRNFEKCGLDRGVMDKLLELKGKGKFEYKAIESTNMAQWDESKGTVTLNSNVLKLADNYAFEAGMCEAKIMKSKDPQEVEALTRQRDKFQRMHQERILELSAALAHEGTHAFLGNTPDEKADESAGYGAEAVWVKHLYNSFPEHQGKIRDLETSIQDSYPGQTNTAIPRTLPATAP